MTILLNDILNMNPENVTIRLMTTNDEGVEPFNEFQEDRNNIDTWLFWRWKNKYFEILLIIVMFAYVMKNHGSRYHHHHHHISR